MSESIAAMPTVSWRHGDPRLVAGLGCLLVTGFFKVSGWEPSVVTPVTLAVLLGLGFTAGWVILPSAPARRLIAAAIGFVSFFLYHWTVPLLLSVSSRLMLPAALAAVIEIAVFVGVLAAWLVIRARPALSYLVLVIPAVAVLLTPTGGLASFYVPSAAVVMGAWVAHFLAPLFPAPRVRPSAVPAPQPQVAGGSTNGMAIASLILSVVGASVLGVIFGHVAISQIDKTGQEGRALAIAGLVVGYVGIVSWVVGSAWFLFLVAAVALQ